MTTFTEFTPTNLKLVRKELEEILGAWAKSHGLTVELGSMGYENSRFHCKLTSKIPGVASDRDRKDLEMFGRLSGVNIDTKYKDSKGHTHTLVQYDSRKRKNPWISLADDGRKYVWTTEAVRKFFGTKDFVPVTKQGGN